MEHRSEAVELVLNHNKLTQSTRIVELLLEGKTAKMISGILKVSLPQVYRVKGKYVTTTKPVEKKV